jgi:hypothetical protein
MAHVVGVFEEESAKLGDESAALEQTAMRFGNPAEVTSQFQESVPARDAVRRYWEGRPGEPAWRTAIRFACVSGTFALVVAVFFLTAASFSVGPVGGWSREALFLGLCAVLTLPAWLSGCVFLTSFMEKALYGPAGRSWPKVALAVACSCLFALLWFAAWSLLTGSAEWDYPNSYSIVMAGFLLVSALLLEFALAQSSFLQRQYHEEWAGLQID